MENEEVIRRRMEETRQSLSEKLAALEEKVTGSVSAVADTVASVSDKVHEGVESMKGAVDVRAHVEHRPWLTLGASVLCGFVLGNVLLRNKDKTAQPAVAPPRTPQNTNGNGRASEPKPKISYEWLDAFEPEIRQLKSLALGATLGSVREMLTEQVPPHMADRLRDIIDAVTEKAGGETIPSSDWDTLKSPKPEPECSGAN